MSDSGTPRAAKIYVGKQFAGRLEQHGNDFTFTYDAPYRDSTSPLPVSLTLPLSKESHRSVGRIHPFFAGLMQEGWAKGLAERDHATTGIIDYLVRYCGDTIGDVGIGPLATSEPPRGTPLVVEPDDRPQPALLRERCLVCLAPLPEAGHNHNYHPTCARGLFGHERPPRLRLAEGDLERLAVDSMSSGIALPGVQRKLPVYYAAGDTHFILKPQVDKVRAVPEIEHLWMRMAGTLMLMVARCGLVENEAGGLVYLTKRFDRTSRGGKLPMEDFAQLTGKSAIEQEKFDASMRDIAAELRRHAKPWKPSIDRLVRMMLFNHVFGNHDAHLKNFATIGLPSARAGVKYQLAPAYDLLPTRFLNGRGNQSALAINGKRDDLVLADFVAEAQAMGLPERPMVAMLADLSTRLDSVKSLMSCSYVPPGIIETLTRNIDTRLRSLKSPANRPGK